MPIPKFHELMLPLLKNFGDGKEHYRYEFVDEISDQFNLTKEERLEKVSNGQARIADRIGWANSFLTNAGLMKKVRRGYQQITPRGQEVLSKNLSDLKPDDLVKMYPDVLQNKFYNPELRENKEKAISDTISIPTDSTTPNDKIDEGYNQIQLALKAELLDQVKNASPKFFEQLVVDLLVAMGYGGSVEEAGETTKYTNDEGIDGIIKEDILGLDNIYIQAKRWQANVGRVDIQNFVGALSGKKATKGIFITTSDFNSNAVEYAKNVDKKIILINGSKLAEFMINHDIGVSTEFIYKIKKIDSDYFEG